MQAPCSSLCKCQQPNILEQSCKGGCENCRNLNYIVLKQNIFYLECKQVQDKTCKCQKCVEENVFQIINNIYSTFIFQSVKSVDISIEKPANVKDVRQDLNVAKESASKVFDNLYINS